MFVIHTRQRFHSYSVHMCVHARVYMSFTELRALIEEAVLDDTPEGGDPLKLHCTSAQLAKHREEQSKRSSLM